MTDASEQENGLKGDAERARAERVNASKAFLENIQARSRTKLAPCRVAAVAPSRLSAELSARIAMLRRLAQPRTDLPPRLASYRLLRSHRVKPLLLRLWNYFSRPSRTQALLAADCLDLIGAQLGRTPSHAD